MLNKCEPVECVKAVLNKLREIFAIKCVLGKCFQSASFFQKRHEKEKNRATQQTVKHRLMLPSR